MRLSFDYAPIGEHNTCPNCKQDFINDERSHILCKHCSADRDSGFFKRKKFSLSIQIEQHLGIYYLAWLWFVLWIRDSRFANDSKP